MIRLSTKSQYGVRAMYEIACGYPDRPVSAPLISEKQDVPVPFLEQILTKLRKAGIIKSVKGPGGGYLLNGSPESITIWDIVEQLDGPMAITSCLDPQKGCVRIDNCVTHLLWKSLGNHLKDFLSTISVNDLVNGVILEKIGLEKAG
ncbi:MAG: Rrf2 family transcriptional regulator [Nitrospirae bacterium]|nr:Rrf2 family transcriptional regulator [Nitrospirota bacterium]MBF0540611.1 Rrf2 family transcriptional regulator [Nitrospirota bacterium]